MARDQNLLEAIRLAGGPGKVGGAFGITREAVQQWRRCPAERVIQLDRLIESQITRHQLRPDLYPADEPREAAA
jgi:DNA-binding transcriptional regulator YdaS (Cro superfamily)